MNTQGNAWLRAASVALMLAVRGLRFTAFAVLSTFEPLVRFALIILALGGFATCILYRYLLHAPHFPFVQMLLLSLAACVVSVLYGLWVRALSPR
jgi:hypothetical protein